MAQQVRSIPNLDTTFVVVRAGSGDRVIGKGNTVVVHAAGTVVGHPRPVRFWFGFVFLCVFVCVCVF